MDPIVPTLAERLTQGAAPVLRPLIAFSPAATSEGLDALPDPNATGAQSTGASSPQPDSLIVASLAVTPATVDLALGSEWEFHAVATFKDGSQRDASRIATWTVDPDSGAVVVTAPEDDTHGALVAARAPGVVTVSAQIGDVKASARVLARDPASPVSTVEKVAAGVPRWVWWAAGGVAAVGLVALLSRGGKGNG